jgi:class 3 adenylate cyclase
MNAEIKADFLDLRQLFPPEILNALKATPHLLNDNFGNALSQSGSELPPEESIIFLGDKEIARLRAQPQLRETMARLLQSTLALEFRSMQTKLELDNRDLLTGDMDYLMDLSEVETVSFEALLQNMLRLLRSHVWVEKASVFGIYDGFTLEGLAGIGGDHQENWRMNFASVAGVAATTRRPYHTEDPASDPNFRAGKEPCPRNLICYPLMHGKTLVGVMNLSNRIGGPFTDHDKSIIERFCNLSAHLLQKHYFKTKMQKFERTSDHLGKYLSSKVVSSVKSKGALQLGGEVKKVVCLFSDIRGYTSITENISPATLVQLLNFHFEKMHAIIEKYEGTLDKIVGDLIMAVWNIPNDQPEPELLAMKAAIEMQKEMIRVVAPEWAKHGVEKVGMGVGVNAGLATVGNLGSSRFMNYTVIGDAVNTAQRLESKAQAAEVWMAEALYPFVAGKLEKPARKETNIRLKGKENTIDAYVYRPLGY